MKLCLIPKTFYSKTADLLREVDSICSVLFAKGFRLSLRQVYYQLVSRNCVPNVEQAYKNLSKVISDGRYAGELDWEHITDRARVLKNDYDSHWAGAEDLVHNGSETLHIDTWIGLPYRPEVWCEKDALSELVGDICEPLGVPFTACKGYESTSFMWETYKRFRGYMKAGQTPIILYLGDHDFSGIDMPRDIGDRIKLMMGKPIEVRRLALNPDQVEKYGLPPQPGKTPKTGYKGDPRWKRYLAKHQTTDVWELDALDPEVLQSIIENGIRAVLNEDIRLPYLAAQAEGRETLAGISEHYFDVKEFIGVVSNGTRDGYEAWRALAANPLETKQMEENRTHPVLPLAIKNQTYPVLSPVVTDKDAEIAEAYAEAMGAAEAAS